MLSFRLGSVIRIDTEQACTSGALSNQVHMEIKALDVQTSTHLATEGAHCSPKGDMLMLPDKESIRSLSQEKLEAIPVVCSSHGDSAAKLCVWDGDDDNVTEE